MLVLLLVLERVVVLLLVLERAVDLLLLLVLDPVGFLLADVLPFRRPPAVAPSPPACRCLFSCRRSPRRPVLSRSGCPGR